MDGKTLFLGIFGTKLAQNIFFSKVELIHIWTLIFYVSEKKIRKFNGWIFNEVQKTLFLGIFGPKFAQENFFSKNELIHILDIVILRLRKKNQKNLMDGFLSKSKKPYFWAFLGPNWPKKIFFRKMYSFIFWTLLFYDSVQKIRKI